MKGLLFLVVMAVAGHAHAHGLQYSVDEGAAVSVKLSFADGSEVSFERYEIYRAGDETPFQVGRTDIQGRVVFIPDRAGTWRLKVFSEDGHGADLSFTAGGEGGVQDANEPFFERHLRIIVGASVIFGVFGLVNLFARRGRRG